ALQATLQVLIGPEAGRRIHLKSGQVARFGRTEWADFAFPYDRAMADVHFAIETGDDAVTLADVSKGKGVLVDGQKVETCVLRSGQRIAAGGLVFGVGTEALFGTSATGTGPITPIAQPPAAAPVELARKVSAKVDLSDSAKGLLDDEIGVLPYL